jgi:hypothetical protein
MAGSVADDASSDGVGGPLFAQRPSGCRGGNRSRISMLIYLALRGIGIEIARMQHGRFAGEVLRRYSGRLYEL